MPPAAKKVPPAPRRRQFRVEITRTLLLDIDERLIESVDAEWRSQFYPLYSATEIAEHIGYNLARGARLSQLDGFADQKDDAVTIVEDDSDTSGTEVTT